MVEIPPPIESNLEIIKNFVRRQFDGITFLWRTSETRSFLKLLALLFGFMTIAFTAIYLIIAIFGVTNFFIRLNVYVFPFMLILFVIILIEFVRFYQNDRKYNLFPERNPLLQMKYWPSTKDTNRRRMLILSVGLLFLILVALFAVVEIFLIAEIYVWAELIFVIGSTVLLPLMLVLLFITAFITAYGAMKSFGAKYSEKLAQQRYWFLIFLPLPWIIFIILFFSATEVSILSENFFSGEVLTNWYLWGLFTYLFLGVVGLITFLNQKWWVRYTASQLAASLTFLLIILIPGFIGLAIDLLGLLVGGYLGPLISLILIVFFYFQGTLDGYGDELNEYYAAWDKKLEQFNIKSEEDIINQKYDKTFEQTPLPTSVPNAYRNLIGGLLLLLLTFFGVIFVIGSQFSILGTAEGAYFLELYLPVTSFLEVAGMAIGIFVSTIILVFRGERKEKVIPESSKEIKQPIQQQIFCSQCGAPNKPESTFCVNCGKKL
ncbi:MAG: zinc ribbon domain-containing protein [Candidatus Hermodarchaeota archaeon]